MCSGQSTLKLAPILVVIIPLAAFGVSERCIIPCKIGGMDHLCLDNHPLIYNLLVHNGDSLLPIVGYLLEAHYSVIGETRSAERSGR